MSRLIDGVFDAFFDNTRHVGLLADENRHNAKHFDQMPAAKQLMTEVLELTKNILAFGQGQGVFRDGLDPVLVYMSIAGLATSYMANAPMNSRVFGRDFNSRNEIESWRSHVKVTLLSGFCTRSPQ